MQGAYSSCCSRFSFLLRFSLVPFWASPSLPTCLATRPSYDSVVGQQVSIPVMYRPYPTNPKTLVTVTRLGTESRSELVTLKNGLDNFTAEGGRGSRISWRPARRSRGVSRTIAGPPPLHSQTGETPVWWKPPSTDFRATEVMLWYKQYASGVGRATYTAFDQHTGMLWIYEYACQHDILWPNGEVPPGKVFRSTSN